MALPRRDLILKYIVEYFIKTAAPVGSNTLIEQYDLPYSSATIRNEMMELEEEGFIEKTHTSSGRVPSTKGYRYYIEHLRQRDVDEEIKQQLAVILSEKSKSIDDVIKESCEILSHMTNLASIVLGPSADEEHLLSVQVIPLSENSATAVFVTDKGYVENKTFILPEHVDIKDVEKCVKIIQDRMRGTPISGLIEKMEASKEIITQHLKNNDAIYRAFAETFLKFATERISFFGTDNLLEQPEFNTDIEKLKRLVRLIENPKTMAEYLHANDDVEIFIGRDEEGKGFDDVSMVTTKIKISDDHEGRIALVGPTRMDYEKVMNALEYIQKQLNEFFARKDDDDGRK